MRTTPCREVARGLFHLNGTSRVVLERFETSGMANGGEWDIPTGRIPPGLRRIGTRFVIVGQHVRGEAGDTAEQLRAAFGTLGIEHIGPTNET